MTDTAHTLLPYSQNGNCLIGDDGKVICAVNYGRGKSYEEAEAIVALIVKAVNSHSKLAFALSGMMNAFGGYVTPEVDAAISAMQDIGEDRWSMQAQMDKSALAKAGVK